MNSLVGFTIIHKGTDLIKNRARVASDRVMVQLKHLKQYSITLGETTLELWGRDECDECIHKMPDGSILALIGSPIGLSSWQVIEQEISKLSRIEDFRIPWDGRAFLLYISADGNDWIFWNDWLGSVPVFYSESDHGRIASTLEPVIVSACAFTVEDFFIPGITYMLMHGHFLGEWTMFKGMKTIQPDAVHIWHGNTLQTKPCSSIGIKSEHGEKSYDDLLEEMHHLLQKAITNALKVVPSWMIPLSSGLDSRLIAAVAAEAGCDATTLTWGPSNTKDVIFASRIAATLGLPWQRIDLGDDYLHRYAPIWSDLFGSAMHFAGIYQIPFLEAIQTIPSSRKIISGFLGGSLSGCFTKALLSVHREGKKAYFCMPEDYLSWDLNGIKALVKFPLDDALEEISAEIEKYRNIMPGPWYQRVRLVDFWGRQNCFIYYQTVLGDYWRGSIAPYINQEYARFCLSIPRIALDDRRLLVDMMKRYYPKVMSIGGTYASEPGIISGSYILKKRLSRNLPAAITHRLFPEFSSVRNLKTDVINVRAGERKAIWPIDDNLQQLGELFNLDVLESAYQSALGGDILGVRKLQAVQAVAHRL